MLIFGMIIFGLLIGPFVGIVVDRAVNTESPQLKHRCPVPIGGSGEVDPDELPELCRQDLGPKAMVPILGWFSRCPVPGHSHWRYAVTDIATAVGFGAMAYRFGSSGLLPIYLILVLVLVAASVIDLETRLLLDVITKPAMLAMAMAVLVFSPGMDLQDSMWPALVAGAFYFILFGIMHLISPAGLGRGDVKLAPTLGMAIGWLSTSVLEAIMATMYSMIIASLASFVVGAVAGIVLVGDWRKYPVPMGPFLAAGALVMVVLSGRIA